MPVFISYGVFFFGAGKFIKVMVEDLEKMKIIITAVLLFFLGLQAQANTYFRAEQTGIPIITSNSVVANLNLSYFQSGHSKLFVRSADGFIVNNENPSVKIPVSNLYILCDGQSYQISDKGWHLFFSDPGEGAGVLNKNVNLRLENIGELPSGMYSVLLKFMNRDGNMRDYEGEYMFSFSVEEKQTISSFSGEPLIRIGDDDIFNSYSTVKNQNDIRLDLSSNTKWKLCLDTSNIGQLEGEYYFYIKNVTGSVVDYERNRTRILPNRRYFLARGTDTIDGVEGGNSIPTNLVIEYSVRNPDSKSYIKEGIRQNPFTYIIEKE